MSMGNNILFEGYVHAPGEEQGVAYCECRYGGRDARLTQDEVNCPHCIAKNEEAQAKLAEDARQLDNVDDEVEAGDIPDDDISQCPNPACSATMLATGRCPKCGAHDTPD